MLKSFGSLLVLTSLLLASCGPKGRSFFHFGKTTKKELIAEKGEPLREEKLERKDAVVLVYPEDEKFQIENDVVTNHFVNPSEEESTVLFWKHKFKNCETRETLLDKDAHGTSEMFFACDQAGQGVVYNAGASHISRMIEYEKK